MNAVQNASYSREEIENFLIDDKAFVQLANRGREALFTSPSQSHFKVYAILLIEKVDGSLCLVHGANTEQGYIGGSICAERSALCALRFYDNPIIRRVVVVTDSNADPTSPGVLCRDYMMSHAQPEISVVMGNASGDIITRCTLAQLYPFPYLYRYKDRSNVVEFAKSMSALLVDGSAEAGLVALMASAQAVNKHDTLDDLHPIRFSAAVLFEDGTVETAWMMKGLEYGCTLDPVSQLVHVIANRRFCAPCGDASITESDQNPHQAGLHAKPKLLVMCDQFGVAHAPFAQARSLLYEHGYQYVRVAVHDAEGALHVTTVEELVPQPQGTSLPVGRDFH